jgi:hypothetical protein
MAHLMVSGLHRVNSATGLNDAIAVSRLDADRDHGWTLEREIPRSRFDAPDL